MRHLARLLHIFQQWNVRQNTPGNSQLIHVRSVTRQSASVTKYSFQCTNSNGWAQSLAHHKSRQCLLPVQGVSISCLTPSHSHPATSLVCPNYSGDRIFSVQSAITPSKAWGKHLISFFQNLWKVTVLSFVLWQTCLWPNIIYQSKNFLFSHLLSQCLPLYHSSL